jgi:hypothetical protein
MSPSQVQIFSSAPCSRTPSICVLPLGGRTKFLIHKKQVKLYIYIFYYLRFYRRQNILNWILASILQI